VTCSWGVEKQVSHYLLCGLVYWTMRTPVFRWHRPVIEVPWLGFLPCCEKDPSQRGILHLHESLKRRWKQQAGWSSNLDRAPRCLCPGAASGR